MIKFIDENGIIDPKNVAPNDDKLSELGVTTCIMLFSAHLFDELCVKYSAVKVGCFSGTADMPIYVITVEGKSVAVVKSGIGAPAAVGMAEEILATKCVHNLVAFGICGSLIDVPTRSFVVPDKAFRDEGTSYHYAPPTDYVELNNADYVEHALKKSGLSTVKGGVWTTDGFYRETKTRMNEMKNNGCIAVDMECSALQTLCNFRKKNFYTFFITADSLAGGEWEPNYILDVEKHAAPDEIGVAAAVKLACELE